jgi:hypothetical protein
MAKAQQTFRLGDNIEAAERSYEERREILLKIVNDFAGEQDISPGLLSLLLVDIGVGMYMLEYMLTTEKPSVIGLRLELDRFRREIDDFIRSSKKSADKFVPEVKKFLNEVEADEEGGKARVA